MGSTWGDVAAVGVALAGLGAGVDRLLLRASKRRLYNWLSDAWFRLGQVPLADLPASCAGLILLPFARLGFGQRRPRSWALALFCSGMLTAVMSVAGRLARRAWFPDYEQTFLPVQTPFVEVVNTHVAWIVGKLPHYLPALAVNFVFDSLTVHEVESKFQPFTLLGVFFGTLGILAKLVAELSHAATS